MIHNTDTNEVVVQDKIDFNWSGITFPGGHIENGEGVVESTIREVREETGLEVRNLKYCGLINWYNTTTHERWFIFLYKTNFYTGELLDETEEGKVMWVEIDSIQSMDLAPDMKEYLKLFLDDKFTEAYATWSEDEISKFEFY